MTGCRLACRRGAAPLSLAARDPARPLAEHLHKLSGGGLQFPGMPPLDPNQSRDRRSGGGDDSSWLHEVNTKLGELQTKYPHQTLEKILQRDGGYSADDAAEVCSTCLRIRTGLAAQAAGPTGDEPAERTTVRGTLAAVGGTPAMTDSMQQRRAKESRRRTFDTDAIAFIPVSEWWPEIPWYPVAGQTLTK